MYTLHSQYMNGWFQDTTSVQGFVTEKTYSRKRQVVENMESRFSKKLKGFLVLNVTFQKNLCINIFLENIFRFKHTISLCSVYLSTTKVFRQLKTLKIGQGKQALNLKTKGNVKKLSSKIFTNCLSENSNKPYAQGWTGKQRDHTGNERTLVVVGVVTKNHLPRVFNILHGLLRFVMDVQQA